MLRFPSMVIDGFLPTADRDALYDFSVAREADFQPAFIREGTYEGVLPEARNSLTCKAPLGRLAEIFTAAIRDRRHELFAGVGIPPFEVHDYELELAANRDGSFFKRHIDTMTGHSRSPKLHDRILTAVYYFHAEPRRFSGGELALYPFGPGEPELFEPADNRLVAFPANAPHEVMPVSGPAGGFEESRFSINCWLKRRRAQ